MVLQEGWTKEEWAQSLIPLLTGEVQHAYYALPPMSAKEYTKIKEKVLAQYGLFPCQAVVKFHRWTYHPNLIPHCQIDNLLCITKAWLQPDNQPIRSSRRLPQTGCSACSHQLSAWWCLG